jgi:low affinity Fe/Cu permease
MKTKLNFFERFANWATQATGSSAAFIIATTVIVVWAVTGPIFKYSDTWQLVINTGTTIVTFLMVFLIQKSQNKDSKAIHLKLNELLASHQGASNRMVSLEDLSEAELQQLSKFYVELSALAVKEEDITCTHSIDAAGEIHKLKQSGYLQRESYKTWLNSRKAN